MDFVLQFFSRVLPTLLCALNTLSKFTKHAVLSLSLFSFFLSASSMAATLEFSDCPREKGKWSIFGAECGTLAVAENPVDGPVNDPINKNGKQIDLNILRIPSIRESDKAPIFFIAGGPGQASTELARSMRVNFSDILTDRDFVFVDQRGTGKSNPLNCDINALEYMDLTTEEFIDKQVELLKECVASTDANFVYYTTPYAVQDLEQVREALGYEQIHLWGGSYGTRVILEYHRSYPKAIARSVLDGVAPISLELPNHTNADASVALQQIFAHCKNDTKCRNSFGDLEGKWTQLLKSLKDEPKSVSLPHPRTKEILKVKINDATLSSQVRLSLYNREISSILPLAIHKAIEQDFSILSSIILTGFEKNNEMISEVLHLAVLCNEDQQLKRFGKSLPPQKHAPLISAMDEKSFAKLCAIFPEFSIDPEYFADYTSQVPSLLLSGRIDPVTPPLWADVATKKLVNSQHIIAEGGHHGISGLGCMPKIIQQFYDGAELPLDTKCVNDIRMRAFFIDNAGPALTAPEIEEKEEQASTSTGNQES